ncbi:hypothetical protein B0H16DRAFT_1335184, partial [Mycena metata]
VMNGRNLILCFDGTTNKFGEERITNIVRMFELLEKNEANRFCYYQPRIGTYDAKIPLQEQKSTLSSKISMTSDAIFANGMRKHILGGYRFLMAHYHSNDRIYMFGFSRGAYTIRALCGMLEKVGLVSYGNDERVEFAWEMYQKGTQDLAVKFQEVFSQRVQIHFLGLWCASPHEVLADRYLIVSRDTVKSTQKDYLEPQTDSFVSYVFHALALHERRVNFQPHIYCRPTPSESHVHNRPPTQIFERYFIGDHSDVGGRFPFQNLAKDALANPSFRWIVWAAVHAAGEHQLHFNTRAFHKYHDILIYELGDHDVTYMLNSSPTEDSKGDKALERELKSTGVKIYVATNTTFSWKGWGRKSKDN